MRHAVAQLAGDLGDEVRDVREPLASIIRSTRTVPGTQTRDRSLRPRSTSITCSARSFSEPSSRSASPSPARRRPGDRVDARAAALGLDERLGRGADQREVVAELQEEEVRRRVDTAKRAVELDRRRRTSAARRAARARSGTRRPRGCAPSRRRRCARTRAGRECGEAAPDAGAVAVGISPSGPSRSDSTSAGSPAEHLGHPGDVVEADEDVGDDEAGLGEAGPSVGERHGGLELRDVVVGDVADDRLAVASASSRSTIREPAPTSE